MPSRSPAWRRGLPAVALVLLTACGAAGGSPALTVTEARVPQPAGPNGAAYMTLTNDGDGDDRLVAVEADVAGEVQIHESTLDGGVMSMQQVDGVDVPAGDTVSLEPGGLHVMLLDVREELAVGDTVTLTLSFGTTGEQAVEAEVVPLVGGDAAEDHGAGDHAATHAPSEH